MSKPTIYVAGPMRGMLMYNTPLFDLVADCLGGAGLTVVNPAQLDRERGFDVYKLDADHDWSQFPDNLDLEATIREDLDHVLKCDAIIMLPGWEKSKGAQCEHATANWAGKEIYFWRKAQYFEVDNLASLEFNGEVVKRIRPENMSKVKLMTYLQLQLGRPYANRIAQDLIAKVEAADTGQILGGVSGVEVFDGNNEGSEQLDSSTPVIG